MAVSTLQITCLVLAVLALALALFFGVSRTRARRGDSAPPPVAPCAAVPVAASSATSATSSVFATQATAISAAAAPASQSESPDEMNARLEILHRLQLLALSSDAAPPADSPIHEEIASKVRWALASITDKPSYAPRRPMLLPKLVQAMNNEDVSRRELADIIMSDPGLSASLFRVANSSFYRISNAPIENLDRAVALLGIEGMHSLVAAALMQPVFNVENSGFPKFGDVVWQHTLASASMAESHAVMLESADPFAAQLLALIMGVATIVTFKVAIDEYQSKHLPPSARVLMTLIDSQAAPVARQIAASWQLSERITIALSDQSAAQGVKLSALGRSLQFGRFLGALALLHQRRVIDDESISAALRTGGNLASIYERIWAKRAALQKDREDAPDGR